MPASRPAPGQPDACYLRGVQHTGTFCGNRDVQDAWLHLRELGEEGAGMSRRKVSALWIWVYSTTKVLSATIAEVISAKKARTR